PLNLNPLLDIEGVINESRKDRILTNINLEVDIIKGLKYRANFGYDYRTARDGSYQRSMSTPRAGKSDFASFNGNSTTDLLLENVLFYDKRISDKHRFGITVMQSIQTNKFEQHSASAE